jgi:hypothetical protein
MTIQQHAYAVLGLLAADVGPPPLAVYDGFVPNLTEPPYVVVYFSLISPEAESDTQTSNLLAESKRVDFWIYANCVGSNGIAARAVSGRVRSALLDVTPAVTGRFCWPIRHVENQPAVRDETTGRLVMNQVDVYRLSSIPNS